MIFVGCFLDGKPKRKLPKMLDEEFTRWWFQIFLFISPLLVLDQDSHVDLFLNGLKPPTRFKFDEAFVVCSGPTLWLTMR